MYETPIKCTDEVYEGDDDYKDYRKLLETIQK